MKTSRWLAIFMQVSVLFLPSPARSGGDASRRPGSNGRAAWNGRGSRCGNPDRLSHLLSP